ncbi:nuclease-related domain-containing protein [Alkalihalobacterium elongatum]|uniref:nuclease-related domain-containing protein n=1 Tax=Alkalihalobacterium elongatum TaxID=2675466 RepID=UPI0038B3E152
MLEDENYLPRKDNNHLLKLEKGFTGELKFDKWLEDFSLECLVLNDLLLEYNQTIFQFDTLILTKETIYIIEIKNYEGDFIIEGERWYTITKKEINNPLLQLKRSESLLHRIIKDYGYHFSIQSYLIFINPHFHLYQALPNLPIIFPTQLDRFKQKMNNKSLTLGKTPIQTCSDFTIYPTS